MDWVYIFRSKWTREQKGKGWIGFTFSDQSGRENRRGKEGLGLHFQIKVDERTEEERKALVYIL